MALDPTAVKLSSTSESSLVLYLTKAQEMAAGQYNLRGYMQLIDAYYMRETDKGAATARARMANRAGDKSKFQDVTVPVVMPQVETALEYLVDVFLSGHPIFKVAAAPGSMDAAMQIEAIIEENAIRAGWARELSMFFRDGLKYNLQALECNWAVKKVPAVEASLVSPTGTKNTKVSWEGNELKRLDLYNTFFDTRVRPTELHERGEFVGYTEIVSRIELLTYLSDVPGLSDVVKRRALEAGTTVSPITGQNSVGHYCPVINPYPSIDTSSGTADFDWMAWASNSSSKNLNRIQHKSVYEKTTLYARILPSDFSLDVLAKNTPQIWKFVFINRSVIVSAERLTHAHGYLPVIFGQPIEDGLEYQTKSFAANVMDMQDTASVFWNGYMASKRRLIGDRMLYDPSRISPKDMNSPNPVAKIPVRSSAFGTPVGDSVYQIPYRDEQTQSLLQGSEFVTKYANQINGQNPATQGQFVKGNKTKEEYNDVVGNSNGRNRLMAIMCESQVMTPLKEMIKFNILQYQPSAVIFSDAQEQSVTIDPAKIRKSAIQFKVSDGVLPQDKQMSTQEFQVALQLLGSSPQLAASYNMQDLVAYMFKLRGADLRPFAKSQLQLAYEQQLGAWQQMAMEAVKAGQQAPPQPQMPPELIAELQKKQSTTETSAALQATQE